MCFKGDDKLNVENMVDDFLTFFVAGCYLIGFEYFIQIFLKTLIRRPRNYSKYTCVLYSRARSKPSCFKKVPFINTLI